MRGIHRVCVLAWLACSCHGFSDVGWTYRVPAGTAVRGHVDLYELPPSRGLSIRIEVANLGGALFATVAIGNPSAVSVSLAAPTLTVVDQRGVTLHQPHPTRSTCKLEDETLNVPPGVTCKLVAICDVEPFVGFILKHMNPDLHELRLSLLIAEPTPKPLVHVRLVANR
jgi:hypothetical protein